MQADRDWRPSAPLAALQLRATLLARIRAYFARNNVMEVDTPSLSTAATTDPAIHSLATAWHGPGLSLIHISEPTRPPLLSRMPSSA